MEYSSKERTDPGFDPTFGGGKNEVLDEGMGSYLYSLVKALDREHEDKEVLKSSFLREIKGKEVFIACHHDGSKILESLIKETFSLLEVEEFLEIVIGNLDVVSDRFGSFVTQSILVRSRMFLETTDDDRIYDLLAMLTNRLKKELVAHIYNMNANHVVRSLLITISGCDLCARGILVDNFFYKNDGLNRALEGIVTKFFHTIDLGKHAEVLGNQVLSPLFQMMIKFCNMLPFIKDRVRVVLRETEKLERLSFDKVGSQSVQSLMCSGILEDRDLRKYWDVIVRDKVERFILNGNSNHILQDFISAIRDKTLYREVLERIGCISLASRLHREGFWFKRIGVILRIVEKNDVFGKKRFYYLLFYLLSMIWELDERKSILDKFCSKSRKLDRPKYLNLKKFLCCSIFGKMDENMFDGKFDCLPNVDSQGCILVSKLFCMKRPFNGPYLKSFGHLSERAIFELSFHKIGSYVVQSFFGSACASGKNAVKLNVIRRLLSYEVIHDNGEGDNRYSLVNLCNNTFGSHVLENMYQSADFGLKSLICKNLRPHRHRLARSRYGSLVITKIDLLGFVKDYKMWRDANLGLCK